MAKIYIGQTKLDLVTKVGQDITGATSTLLKYKKPDGTTGNFSASITNAALGEITYNVGATDLDVVGRWTFWAYIIFSDSKIGIGTIFSITVSNEGN